MKGESQERPLLLILPLLGLDFAFTCISVSSLLISLSFHLHFTSTALWFTSASLSFHFNSTLYFKNRSVKIETSLVLFSAVSAGLFFFVCFCSCLIRLPPNSHFTKDSTVKIEENLVLFSAVRVRSFASLAFAWVRLRRWECAYSYDAQTHNLFFYAPRVILIFSQLPNRARSLVARVNACRRPSFPVDVSNGRQINANVPHTPPPNWRCVSLYNITHTVNLVL